MAEGVPKILGGVGLACPAPEQVLELWPRESSPGEGPLVVLGGAFVAPVCVPPPGSGTVEVLNASGAVVATQTSEYGHFVEIPLPPGSYTVNGAFLDTTSNGAHPKKTESVVIPPSHTVRQDFFLSIS